MKKYYQKNIICILIIFLNCKIYAESGNNLPFDSQPKQQITFTENKGQVSDQNYKPRTDVLFSGSVNGMVYHLRNNGISYQLNRIDSWKEEEGHKTKEKIKVPDQSTIYRLDINWLGINKNFIIETENALDGYSNYYLDVCPNGVSNVKAYNGVYYNNIYNKIDLHYYEKNNNLKYDYIVAPGGNYKNIQLQVNGADKVEIQKDGSIVFETPLGKIQEGAPLVYQKGKLLKAKWIIQKNILTFDIDDYNSQLELLIDPLTRVWGTYYGGNQSDRVCSSAGDGIGNVYITGYTQSNIGIATSGAHQSIKGNYIDAFLIQFNGFGQRQWGTFLGGSGSDYGFSSATSADGSIYLTGRTDSDLGNIIATPGSHQPTYLVSPSNLSDGFLVKFNSLGIRQWGTYYGDMYDDESFSCATDLSGNIYISGTTGGSQFSNTLIATTTSHQPLFGGGATSDAFLAKFNSFGQRLWSTFYGGMTQEYGKSCATDVFGNVYIAGLTTGASNAISTSSGHQPFFGGGSYDGFLVKFDSLGTRLWGTFYGGLSNDDGLSCTADSYGDVFLTGMTSANSGTAIITQGSHQTVFGGINDCYLVKFNSLGQRIWATYYGGNGYEEVAYVATDQLRNVYLCGLSETLTGTAVATANSYQSINGGNEDAFLAKFNSFGQRQWGTYYGGSGFEYSSSLVLDLIGNIYLTGYTTSNNGTTIATNGCHQLNNGGGYDGFLVKFNETGITNLTTSKNNFSSISIFPNPTSANIVVELEIINGDTKIEIYNSLGQMILLENLREKSSLLDLHSLENGIYFLKITEGNKSILNSKIIKE